MKIRYIDKTFARKSKELIEHCNEIIEDMQSQGYTLTLRQLYYQLVGKALIENTQKSYDRVGSVVNDARLAGLIDWDAIEDRGRNLYGLRHQSNAASAVMTMAYSYRLDKWEGQRYRKVPA